MKLLNDYSKEELVALTDDEKHQLFLLECAERGITLPDATPKYMEAPSDRDDLRPDTMVYGVSTGRYSSDKVSFKTIEEAQAVADLINRTGIATGYTYVGNTRVETISGGPAEVVVESVQAFTTNKFAELKEELAIYEKSKTKVDANNQRRDKIVSEHTKLMSEIDEVIDEAERDITRLNEFTAMFAQYKKMASGNHEIAVRFLLNAHYGEISDYNDQQLEVIGFSRGDLDIYIESSKQKEEAN